MPEQPDPKIKELEDRLDALVRTQIDFQKEISDIRRELIRLNATRIMSDPGHSRLGLYKPEERPTVAPKPSGVPPGSTPTPPVQPSQQPPIVHAPSLGQQPPRPNRPPVRESSQSPGYELPKRTAYVSEPVLSTATTTSYPFSSFISQNADKARENLEEFVGKNLISLVGIVVLILGVGIGAKYAIDNNLISPLTRIIIGYVFGFGLVGLAIRLRKKYHNFSAVLFSGGMAIMYFVTYFAYSAYALIGQLPAFGLMIMFTVFTVTAALVYSRQVIAHIGLVGAYAVPFLLSTDSGNYLALFTYMTVVNTGVLAVSLKKNWTPIFYTASLFTWAIFCGWFATKYDDAVHFDLALIFLAIFFAIFYATKLAHARPVESENPSENQVASLITTVIFYVMCFAITMTTAPEPVRYWTLFTYLAAASTVILATSLWFFRHAFLMYASWLFTWAIFASWFGTNYTHQGYFTFVLVFLGVFVAIFSGGILAQLRLVVDESDHRLNLASALLTGGVFFVMCYAVQVSERMLQTQYWTYFAYIAVASIVMLAGTLKIYGRSFMYLVVPAVWTIFVTWFGMRYDNTQHFELAAIFASLFFAIFYFSILFHRLVEDSFTLIEHTSLILANSFVAYGVGYALLHESETLNPYLGLYTVANALLHLAVALVVWATARKAIDVVQVLTILVLTFASIAVPVQFDGNVITMVWAAESAVLFGYGRLRGVRLFERFSYPVMALATGRMFLDWATTIYQRESGDLGPLPPFANADFVTAVVFVVAFTAIYFIHRDGRNEPAISSGFVRPFTFAVGTIGAIVLYNMFRTEIGNYFYLATVQATPEGGPLRVRPAGDLQLFDIAWQINYTLFFLIGMSVVNLRALRSTTLAVVNWVLALLSLAAFATVSMFIFAELRSIFITGNFNPDVIAHWMYIGIRPISYVLTAGLLYLVYEYCRDSLMEERVDKVALIYAFEGLAYTFVFIVASCELVNLMEQFRLPDAPKLGLSILWGVYALLLIVIGIAKDRSHLRITAIVLLAVTLGKLFFYDISELDTISKTILFVTLGITLLVVSFLYNKYKGVMFKSDTVPED